MAPVDIRQLVLQPGDVLLLSTNEAWADKYKQDRNFTVIANIPKSEPPKKNRGLIAIVLGIAMVLTQIIPGVRNEKEWINLWPGAIVTSMVMVLTGCLSGKQATASIMWDVYLTIAAAFGVSNAMEGTGVAAEFAQVFIRIGEATCWISSCRTLDLRAWRLPQALVSCVRALLTCSAKDW